MSDDTSDTKSEFKTNEDKTGAEASSLTDALKPVSEDINAAIRSFIHQYETQHDAVLTESVLENTTVKIHSARFVSGIVRLNFKYWRNVDGEGERRSSSVLIKIPQLTAHYPLFNTLQMYSKERHMYTSVLPRMYEWWPNREKLTPILYASTSSNILVLENLMESGFHVQKDALFDLADCKVVLKSLAHFHALSAKYLTVESMADAPSVEPTVMSEKAEETFGGCASLLIKLRKHDIVSRLSPKAREKFDTFSNSLYTYIFFGYSPNEDGTNVILHGDTHYYNLLLRRAADHHQSEEETVCKFVDLQCSRRGSPIIDLIYFFVTSVQVQVFEREKESLFEYYLTVLNQTSEQLGIGHTYDLDRLNADFHKYKTFFVYVICSIVPTLWSGDWWQEIVDSKDDIFDMLLKSENYVTAFTRWMEYFA